MLVKGGDDDSGIMSEMNVTPLVDVMLVLLTVFMVTAPLLVPQSIGVNLPKTESVQSPVDRDLVRLLIRPDGSLLFDGKPMTDHDLKMQLAKHANEAKFQLQVEADENLKYGRLAEVMALAQASGIRKLSFVTIAQQNGAGIKSN